MSQALAFSGKFGRAEVDFANGLWRVVFDGKNDWYSTKDDATKVAISLAHKGEPPTGVVSLFDRSGEKRRAQ